MILKTFNITLGVLVALSVWCVWCAALLFAVFVAMLTLHVLVIGGLTIWHLVH